MVSNQNGAVTSAVIACRFTPGGLQAFRVYLFRSNEPLPFTIRLT
jgi:hypothetical protein